MYLSFSPIRVLKMDISDIKLREIYILRDLSEYFRLREMLDEILSSYNVKSSLEILKKLKEENCLSIQPMKTTLKLKA